MKFNSFEDLTQWAMHGFCHAPVVHPPRWQTVDVSKMDHMATHELLNTSFTLSLPSENLNTYRAEVKPNLPWADDHFLMERVGGQPLNPGEQWKHWPGAKNAATHQAQGAFSHSYAERFWPKYANLTEGGKLDGESEFRVLKNGHHGIRFAYGDLETLVTVLAHEPLTRQAYLPVWFPEDLSAIREGARVPCTLGYQFIMRDNRLSIIYYIRSCDYIRHFRDDVYMAIRLLLWVLQQCRLAAPEQGWADVRMGELVMHITSFHIFRADHKIMFKDKK